MPAAALFTVPYDSGHRSARMGRGPGALAAAGAAARLGAAGYAVRQAELEPDDAAGGWSAEIATTFALHRALAARVRDAVAAGALPVVLAGNCGHAVGTVGGLLGGLAAGAGAAPDAPTRRDVRAGVVWLDAHPDFKTPETTTGGFLDGMGLATLTGRCWRAMAAAVPGFRPVAPADVVLVGARDMSDAERADLAAAGVTLVPPDAVRAAGAAAAVGPALERLRAAGVTHAYLHLDLDVHDPAAVGPANAYAAPGGLTAAEVRDVVRAAATALPIAAIGMASYDPAVDADGRVRDAALELLAAAAAVARPGLARVGT